MLVATISDTKAVLALPVVAKGTASLKHEVEELGRFSLHKTTRMTSLRRLTVNAVAYRSSRQSN